MNFGIWHLRLGRQDREERQKIISSLTFSLGCFDCFVLLFILLFEGIMCFPPIYTSKYFDYFHFPHKNIFCLFGEYFIIFLCDSSDFCFLFLPMYNS